MHATVDALKLLDKDAPDDRRPHARDEKGVDKDALPLNKLEAMLADIRQQPSWRNEADKAADYYDGNQLDGETLAKLEERGLGPLVTNLIKPTVDAVLGLEAKTRTDWRVTADDERHMMVAEFLSQKLHEAERESRADRACSDAYAGQVKAGFSFVEVSRETNPFNYEYRVQYGHRRELWWDWRSIQPDWRDARWILRQRWHDPDVLAAYFPQHAPLIKFAAGERIDWQAPFMNTRLQELLVNGITQQERFEVDEMEWRDLERHRIKCYEVWYRTWHRGAVLVLPTGRKIEFNQKDKQHIALAASGLVPIRSGVFDRIRQAFFVGPHRIMDVATSRRRFPYIPFWGYREDLTGAPYGLIRSMLSPQDEVNARRAKMMWLLSQRRTFIDNDALDERHNSLSDASYQLARADAFVVRNKNALNKDKSIQIDENIELGQFQFKLLEEAKNAVQQAGGVYSAMLGQVQAGVTANSAMQTLIEQGTTTLAEINDNFSFGRRMVGEALLELIREDVEGMEMQMLVDTGSSKKSVYVNRPTVDPATGQRFLENNTATTPVKVQLADVPSTPSFRAQQVLQMSEVTKSLTPELQAFVTPFLIEATDLPKRREIAALLRKQLGIQADPDTPEAQEAQRIADEKAAVVEDLNMKMLAADVAEKQARANKANAEAQKALKELEAPEGQPDQSQAIRQEFENRLAKIEQQYREEILRMRVEQARAMLKAEADRLQMQAKYESAIAQAELTTEKEQIASERDIEIANIDAAAKNSVEAQQRAIEDATRRFEEQIAALQQQIKDFKVQQQHQEQLRSLEEKHASEVETLEERREEEVESVGEKAQAETAKRDDKIAELERQLDELKKLTKEAQQQLKDEKKRADEAERAAKKKRRASLKFKTDEKGNITGAEIGDE